MSLYGDYIKELTGHGIVEDDKGFATFSIVGQECYIEDIYVVPEYRQKSEARKYESEVLKIAKERGCKYVTGSVNLLISTPERSIKMLLAGGYKVAKADPRIIYFVKEIV